MSTNGCTANSLPSAARAEHVQDRIAVQLSQEIQEGACPSFSAADITSSISSLTNRGAASLHEVERAGRSTDAFVQSYSDPGKLPCLTVSIQTANLKKDLLGTPSFSIISEIPSQSCADLIPSFSEITGIPLTPNEASSVR